MRGEGAMSRGPVGTTGRRGVGTRTILEPNDKTPMKPSSGGSLREHKTPTERVVKWNHVHPAGKMYLVHGILLYAHSFSNRSPLLNRKLNRLVPGSGLHHGRFRPSNHTPSLSIDNFDDSATFGLFWLGPVPVGVCCVLRDSHKGAPEIEEATTKRSARDLQTRPKLGQAATVTVPTSSWAGC